MEITLVVMAAGMGSRFGGLKQITPVTDRGHFLLDFSVYDAVNAGFNKVVFVIRREFEEEFKRVVGSRVESKVAVEYVIQDTSALPQGRVKPFGTAHAIMCCDQAVKGPFAIINADDYYGKSAFAKIYGHLLNAKEGDYAMVAYKMGNTVSENGEVTRGVCEFKNGKLTKIAETRGINAQCRSTVTGREFLPDTPVSMNLWGLTRNIFPYLKTKFAEFLQTADLQKDEFLIPTVIFQAIEQNVASVTEYETEDKWYGITNREDLPKVRRALEALCARGQYEGM